MSSTNVTVLEAFAREIVARNLDGLRGILHEDVVVHEACSLPYGGDHHGPEGFIGLCEAVDEAWEFTPQASNYTYLEAGPETVLMRVNVEATARATGRRVQLRTAQVFTIREAKIAELEVFYWDTAEMCRALDLSMS